MATKKDLCRDKRGMFVRSLGWKQNGEKFIQQKFYLGNNEAKAQIASLKLEQLWDAVCARWEGESLPVPQIKPDPKSQVLKIDLPTRDKPFATGMKSVVSIGVGELEYVRKGRPLWDEVSWAIAEA